MSMLIDKVMSICLKFVHFWIEFLNSVQILLKVLWSALKNDHWPLLNKVTYARKTRINKVAQAKKRKVELPLSLLLLEKER